MSRALVVLDTEFQRRRASEWCWSLKHGTRVEFKAPKRSDDQNAKMWVMLTEVATQLKWHGQKLTADDWKLQFLDALRRAKSEELRIVPNIDNTGFVNLSTSSSDLSKEEMSDLIELIFKFGAEHDVKFHEPSADTPTADAASEAGEPEAADSQSAAPASPLAPTDEAKWLRDLARLLVASIGPESAVVLNSASGMARDDISQETRDSARSITKFACRACGDYQGSDRLDRGVAIQMIENHAGSEREVA